MGRVTTPKIQALIFNIPPNSFDAQLLIKFSDHEAFISFLSYSNLAYDYSALFSFF